MLVVVFSEMCILLCVFRGVLETLIRRHFPTPSSGIDWTLFENDPTLPDNCRKRKRGGSSHQGDDDRVILFPGC